MGKQISKKLKIKKHSMHFSTKKEKTSNVPTKSSSSTKNKMTNLPTKYLADKDKLSKIPEKSINAKKKTSNIAAKSPTDKNVITDYLSLCANFKSHIAHYRNTWKVAMEETLVFYKMDVSGVPTVVASIKIDKNLRVEAFMEHGKVQTKALKFLLNPRLVLETWTQLQSLLKHFGNKDRSGHISIKHNLIQSLKYLRVCQMVNSKKKDSICLKAKLEFLLSQIDALLYNRYSPNMLFLAYAIYLKSSFCYKYIQSLEFLILPREDDLVKYISSTNMNADVEKL